MVETPKKVLVVTPHPDDAEISCGGTVARWVREGAEVVYVVCTNGDKGSHDPEMTSEKLARIREREQREAAQKLGVKEVVFLGHPDGELEDNREFRGELVREIRRHRPDIVLCPDPYRRTFYLHRDHRITGQVTLDAVFPYARDHLHFPELTRAGFEPHRVSQVLLWGSDEPDTFIDISDTLGLKIEALRCHRSQVSNPDRNFEERVLRWAREVGQKRGLPYAEAFRLISFGGR